MLSFPNATNVDNYPLMHPCDIEKDIIAFPKQEPQLEPEPTTLVIASLTSITVIGIGLLVYFRKRKR